jgi:hypothetical protein
MRHTSSAPRDRAAHLQPATGIAAPTAGFAGLKSGFLEGGDRPADLGCR